MSAEVLRSTRENGCPANTLIKITQCEDSLDTANTLIAVVCNQILEASYGTKRVRCYTADPSSDVIAVECTPLKPSEDGHLGCTCEGSKLAEVGKGKDFTVWRPNDTAELCSQCDVKSIEKGYDEFHKHINEVLSTASPSVHEKDLCESDFLLQNVDEEDDKRHSEQNDDIRTLQAVLSQISGICEVLTLSVTRTNLLILLILLVLFLPIIIIAITPARKQAEIIAGGLAYIPAMLATLAALVTIAPAGVSAKLGKKLVYRKVKTFKELQSFLNLENYSSKQWREALVNMKDKTFNTYPYGIVYPCRSGHSRSELSQYFKLGDWCQMSLGELQSYNSAIRVVSNKKKRVLLVDSMIGRRLKLQPITPKDKFLSVESEDRLSNIKLEDLAHCDEHRESIFKEDINSD